MKLTGNYNLKKPDTTDVVNIQDLNDNVEKLDEELKKLTIKSEDVAFTTATNRTNIVSGDTLKVMLGKIAKWFGDLGGLAFKSKVGVGDLESELIVHDLKTGDVGKVLGADQGVVLQDKLTQVNDNLERGINCFRKGADPNEFTTAYYSTGVVSEVSNPEFKEGKRAGYGFHNGGVQGTFLYADDSKLKYVSQVGKYQVVATKEDLTRYSKRENNAFEKDETILAWALTCLQNSTRFIGTPTYPSDMPPALANKECFVEIKLDHIGARKMVYLSQYTGNTRYCRSIFDGHWTENDWNKCY